MAEQQSTHDVAEKTKHGETPAPPKQSETHPVSDTPGPEGEGPASQVKPDGR